MFWLNAWLCKARLLGTWGRDCSATFRHRPLTVRRGFTCTWFFWEGESLMRIALHFSNWKYWTLQLVDFSWYRRQLRRNNLRRHSHALRGYWEPRFSSTALPRSFAFIALTSAVPSARCSTTSWRGMQQRDYKLCLCNYLCKSPPPRLIYAKSDDLLILSNQVSNIKSIRY